MGASMGSDSPMVSVIVPIYNAAPYLDQALASIEDQTLREVEILCVNDGSTDESPAIMAAHAARDGRIRVIDKPNGGYGSACNVGLDNARGTWIAILEPDDWIEPGMFADMLAFARSFDGEIDIVKTPYWRILNPDTDRQLKVNCSYRRRIHPASQPFAITDPGVDHLIIHHPSIWSAIYRADFLRTCGIRFREIPGAGWADNPFLYETLCQARSIVYLDTPYYCYREETPEKTVAFSQKNMLVPIERWHDMVDVLDRLGVRDENVWRAHIRRGFSYLDHVGAGVNLDAPVIRGYMKDMFDRMDDDLVFSEPHISPEWKREYARVKGVPVRGAHRVPYAASLAEAGVYSLVNIGPVATAAMVGDFFTRGNDAKDLAALDGAAAIDLDACADVKVSVVVPVFNAEAYLDGCLDSLAAQTHRNIEVVCVDDGSTDGSAAILERRAQTDGRIRVVSQENGGPSSARNAGIRAATGDYVCFLDADDFFEPQTCARIASEAKRGQVDAIVYGWTYFADEVGSDGLDDQSRRYLDEHSNVRPVWYPAFDASLVFDEATNPYLRLAVRRDALLKAGVLFDEQLRIGEDAQFLLALYPRIGSVQLIADKLYRYRLPRAGSVMDEAADVAEKCVVDMNMMISIFQDWDRGGLLSSCGAQLVNWFATFLLYTLLVQPKGIREPFTALASDLLRAHFTDGELRELDLPDHTARLVRLVLDAGEQGRLAVSDQALRVELLRWRMAEYGLADLARTALGRLR